MAQGDKLVTLDGLKAVYQDINGNTNDLKSATKQTYNLIPNVYQSIAQRGNPCTINNIKYTANSVGEVTVEAASSSHNNSTYYIARESDTPSLNMLFSLPVGEYTCYLVDDTPTNTRVSITDTSNTRLLDFSTTKQTFTVSDVTAQYRIVIYVASSAVLSTAFVVKPMICKKDDDYAYVAPWGSNAGLVPEIIDDVTVLNEMCKGINVPIVTPYSVHSIAHRGSGNENAIAPENTTPGFVYARKQGFLEIETDVRFTADDPAIPVLIHDETINRTARNIDGTAISSTINVADSTLSTLRGYDYGIFVDSKYAGTQILTLEEGLAIFKKLGVKPYIEIKGTMTDANEVTVGDVAKNSGMLDEITWLSGSVNRLIRIIRQIPNANIGIIYDNLAALTETIVSDVATLRNSYNFSGTILIFVNSHNDNPVTEFFTICKANGLPLYCGAITGDTAITNLNSYISGVVSNDSLASKVLLNELLE